MADTLNILPLSGRLTQDTPFLDSSASRNLNGKLPPPQPDSDPEPLLTCQDTACSWLPFLCSLTHTYDDDHPHRDWEASSACQYWYLRSMLVTAFIIEHGGTIGNTTATRKDPAAASVPGRGTRKRNPSVNDAEQDEDDGREPDEGDRPRTSKRVRSDEPASHQHASFACPFFKMDPIRHQACLFYKMSKISYVKQHLQRTHRGPKWRCTLCQEAFPDQPTYNRHLTAQECKGPQSKVRQDEMTELQWEEIGRLTSRRAGATTESMWYAMFDVLFPGSQRPETPYVESGISEMTKHFREFVKERGPGIIKSHLETSGTWQGLVDSGVNPDTLLQYLLTSGIDLIFDNWGTSTGDAGTHVPAAAEGRPIPRSIFRGEPTSEGIPFQFPQRSQPASIFLPPVSTFYDVRSPLTATDPIASPRAYHARVPSSVSAPETPLISELSTETAPVAAVRRVRGAGSSGSGSGDAGAENVPATPTRGPRDLSITALTEDSAATHGDVFLSPQSER